MGLGLRVFFVDEHDRLKRIPFKLFDQLHFNENKKMPNYAGQRIRYALAYLIVHRKIVISVFRIEYGILVFDMNGFLSKEDQFRRLKLSTSPYDLLYTQGIDEDIKEITYNATYRWKPSPRLERKIKIRALSKYF